MIKPKLSEPLARAMYDVAMDNIATKHDLAALEHSLTVKVVSAIVVAVGFLSAWITLH